MYWPFKTSTHSQSEIFSLKAVIVACSLCSYTVAFQDQHTLPKRNILSHSCYCGLLSLLVCIGLSRPAQPPKVKYSSLCYCSLFSLLVCIGLLRPAHPPKEKYSLSQLLLWLALSAHVYWPFKTSTASQSEIFSVIIACSLCSCVLAFQDQ